MEALIKITLGALAVVGAIFFAVILGTLFGGITGWAVGLVFTDSIAVVKDLLGLACTNFELGACLGFIGGFFRSSLNNGGD